MEKEGLVRGMHFLNSNDLSIELLLTDRHMQIAAWMRNNQLDMKHTYMWQY